MRLYEFIEKHSEDILSEWEAFAATKLPAASRMDKLALRDHAPLILQAIATDLRTLQSADEQRAKAEGRAPTAIEASQTAAEAHGAARALSGFDINQMVGEYRALRASVLRLWSAEREESRYSDLEDVIRFGEAIDQAIAESVNHFSREVDRARNLFLGMLGHELRTPLHAIRLTAQYLREIRHEPQVSKAGERIIDSGARMQALLDDILDYSRTTLTSGIDIEPHNTDLAELCAMVCDELKVVFPDSSIALQISGDAQGLWDQRRLRQVLSNLLINALNYGDVAGGVRIEVVGAEEEVSFCVKNRGPTIPPETLSTLFEPLTRVPAVRDRHGNSHLGLGLFISKQIVKGHGGEIEVQSDGGETAFSVRLPRRAQQGKI